MLTNAIAHGVGQDNIRESALEVDSKRKKSLAAPWTRTRVNIAPGFSILACSLCGDRSSKAGALH